MEDDNILIRYIAENICIAILSMTLPFLLMATV